jgi:hypothetical protein
MSKRKPAHVGKKAKRKPMRNNPQKGKKKGKRKPRRTYNKRAYDDTTRLAAITLAKDIGIMNASRKLNIPHETVEAWSKGFRCPSALQLWHQSAGQLADAFHKAAWDCLAEVANKVEAAPLNHLMNAATNATNAERLLRGQPTVITEKQQLPPSVDLSKLTPDQLKALRELLALARRTAEPEPVAVGEVGRGSGEHSRVEVAGTVRAEGVADPEPRPPTPLG